MCVCTITQYYCRYLLSHVKFTGQVQGHFSEGTRSLGKVMSYFVAGCEIPSPVVSFLPRDAMHKRGLCRRAVSVCLSRSWIVTKRINISSNFFHHRVAKPF